jgi:thioredoxin
MELKPNRIASYPFATHDSIAAVLVVVLLMAFLSGCRSTDVAGTSFTDTESIAESSVGSGIASVNKATDAPSQTPSYAQNVDGQNSAIQLASTESATSKAIQNNHAVENLVTLRTLGVSDDFQQIVRDAPGPVLLDFYADWCGPCRKQGKVLHGLESFAAANQAQIIKVDVEQHKDIARQFDVASLPTLVVLKNGETVDRKVGLTEESRLRKMLR